MAGIVRGMDLASDDPLGTGGLLFDMNRIAKLAMTGDREVGSVLGQVAGAALRGVESFAAGKTLALPATHRLAFRELGLSIGLKGVREVGDAVSGNPDLFPDSAGLPGLLGTLDGYVPLGREIDRFWTNPGSQETGIWREHRDINLVMLATSLEPEGFLGI
jgi:hypothetical protein